MTPLHLATLNHHLNTVNCLVLAGADIDPKNNNGETPLHIASNNGDIEIVRYLIEHGSKIDEVDTDSMKKCIQGVLFTLLQLMDWFLLLSI